MINNVILLTAKQDYIRFNIILLAGKKQLFRIKWEFKHQDLQAFCLKLNKYE